MTPERWQQIDAIVAEAVQYRDGSHRAAFLDRACAGDEGIRKEVEALLSHEADAEPFVAGVVQEAAQQFARSNNLGLEAGERLGAYRILREIGRGGMGTVYLAERADDQFRKQVAIKLVTRGMDTADLLRRFRHERQILARLDHPYIARLLDGGSTDDGRPYLVMEYVEGIPIAKYCAEHALSARARVELFRKVCAAVQSAHQQLVVHRDLKPSNILVDAGGEPKLLDFGIAKLLDRDEAAQFTVPGAMQMLTPDYASPEQVLGERITTAADVYSLGAILYELLAGTPPHRFRTYAPTEIERVVCHDDPPPLQLGDLGNIVSMAMQKEPSRRYGSAAEFSDDLRRFLTDLPVVARDNGLGYRTRKFVRRHGAGVAAALLLLVTLTGGITVSVIQARRAERRFNEVRQLAHAVLYDIDDAIRDLQGSAKAREVVVKTGLQYLDGLGAEAAGDRDIQIEIADAYVRVGDVQGGALMLSLGHTDQALESYRKAMQIADDLGRRHPEYAKADYIRMKSREHTGDILARRRADVADALRIYAEGVEIGEAFRRGNPSDTENLRRLSSLYENIARDETDSAQSIAAAKNALPILEQIAAADNDDEDQQSLCEGYSVLAKTLNYTNQPEEAFRYLEKSLRVREALLAAHPENARYRRQLMIEYSKLGDLMGPFTPTLDNPAAANEYYDKMLAIAEQLASGDPNNPRAAFDHAMALTKKGAVMPADSDAIAVLQQALVIFEGLAKADPKDRRVPVQEANIYYSVARRHVHSGSSDAAIQNYTSAIRLYEAHLGPESKDLQATRGLRSAYEALAKLYAAKNMKTEALEFASKAIATAESARAIDPTNPVTQALLPQSYAAQGFVLAAFSDTKAACAAYTASAAGWERIQPQRGWPKDRDAQLKFSRREAARCEIR